MQTYIYITRTPPPLIAGSAAAPRAWLASWSSWLLPAPLVTAPRQPPKRKEGAGGEVAVCHSRPLLLALALVLVVLLLRLGIPVVAVLLHHRVVDARLVRYVPGGSVAGKDWVNRGCECGVVVAAFDEPWTTSHQPDP